MSGGIIMPECIDMLALPCTATARTDGHLVGWRQDNAIDNASFRRETNRWRQLLGACDGRKFALYMHDTLAFAAALLGAWQAGKTVCLPSDALPDTCKALAKEVDGFIGDVAPQWHPLSLTQADTEAPWHSTDQHANEYTDQLDGDFVGLVVYTSGSTGAAQAIPKKLSQMANEVATLNALFGACMGTSEVVSTVSHQHIYGLLFKVLWPLCAGRPIHARSAFFPEELAAIAPQRPWLLLSSPAHLKRLPDSPVLPDMTQLQGIFSSGGPLLPDIAQATHQLFGHRPIEIYGSSETGGIAWRQPLPDAARNDSWQPMPQV
jgi:acyl-coenzyme A synthetase/AMP-(fatty) acid ligase